MRSGFAALLLTGCLLTACNREEDATSSGPKSPGRYAGIGTFETGRLWREMAGAHASQDPAAAKLADDEHVIIVIDSHTGEIRQCGDHSGVCVAMNPWSAEAASMPVKLTKHAAEIAAEDQKANEVAANETAPATSK